MKIYDFTKEAGKSIEAFGSQQLIMSRILSESYSAHVGCMHLGEKGVIGWHQAPVAQLFLVVNGEGWVRAGQTAEVPISVGYAAYWTQGEWHETRTDQGLIAIIIESQHLDITAILRS
ncbi:cupin [Paenibacillus sp. 19GGS1-52]|uniref:cupin n=1 Tax=Paenibacillus sp. 19GGS1-52 TaxID=2758563 RepID=UPI001EFB6FE4|nr:cupin [Paenibacillus sp. 19GGS1-52]ULO06555.1 cupin [Paenibacillus sp. 19GGS1-52]